MKLLQDDDTFGKKIGNKNMFYKFILNWKEI